MSDSIPGIRKKKRVLNPPIPDALLTPEEREAKKEARKKAAAHLTPFPKGVSGHPGGKPVGTRNRLQGDFMRRLSDDFHRYGHYAIARVRRTDPSTYIRVCASLMPKELEIKQPLDELSDEQLNAAAEAVRAIWAAQLGDGPGAAAEDSGIGTEEAGVVQPAQGLPPVPEAG